MLHAGPSFFLCRLAFYLRSVRHPFGGKYLLTNGLSGGIEMDSLFLGSTFFATIDYSCSFLLQFSCWVRYFEHKPIKIFLTEVFMHSTVSFFRHPEFSILWIQALNNLLDCIAVLRLWYISVLSALQGKTIFALEGLYHTFGVRMMHLHGALLHSVVHLLQFLPRYLP